jgi:hypothetical protein
MWMTKYASIMMPHYFERQDENDFAACALEYWNTYKRPIHNSEDLLELIGLDSRDIVHTVMLGKDEWDLALAADLSVKFAREQAARIAVLESLPDIEKGDLESIVERLKKAAAIGQDIGDLGLDVKREPERWMEESTSSKLSTGLLHLDIVMDGGLGRGELGIFMAPTNYGKSMALINVAFGAAGLINALKVAYFSFEMREAIVAKRIAARMLFRFPSRRIDPVEYVDEFKSVSKVLLPGEIRAFRVSGNTNMLRRKLDALVDSGYEPDVIVVDHGDELEPIRQHREHWLELGETFKQLREVGEDYDAAMWTATQTTRGSVNKDVITMQDIGESYKKCTVADAIIAICQTAEEERLEQCRLFLAKLRDGKSRSMVAAKFYKEQQAIITTGILNK